MSLKDISGLPNFVLYIENYHEAAAFLDSKPKKQKIIRRIGGWFWVAIGVVIALLSSIVTILQGKNELEALKLSIISFFH